MDVPTAIWKLVEQFAIDVGIDSMAALRILLRQLAQSVADGDVGFLSKDFQGALARLRERTYGMITETTSLIDLNKLHRSSRTKSGFVGVYANGKGFRSMVTQRGTLTSIGTFPTAEEAAWRRRKYYLEHGLPYGELEIEMERWRKGEVGPAFKGTDAELIEAIKEHSQRANTYDEIFGDGNNDSLVGATQSSKVKAEPKAIGFDDATADEIFG